MYLMLGEIRLGTCETVTMDDRQRTIDDGRQTTAEIQIFNS